MRKVWYAFVFAFLLVLSAIMNILGFRLQLFLNNIVNRLMGT